MKTPTLILLDVYETILDMTELERRVNNLLDSKRGYTVWFGLFMQYCFVDNCTDQFHSFIAIAKATMQMAARSLGTAVEDEDIDVVLEILKHLPVHDNVQEGLSMLNDQGFRIAALTNAPAEIVAERMDPTGLISYFEMVLSAERIKKYKPAREVYEWAARTLKTDVTDCLVVSAHGWDIAGGVNAGMQTAYMKVSKEILYPLAPSPDIVCANLTDLAYQLQTIQLTGKDV